VENRTFTMAPLSVTSEPSPLLRVSVHVARALAVVRAISLTRVTLRRIPIRMTREYPQLAVACQYFISIGMIPSSYPAVRQATARLVRQMWSPERGQALALPNEALRVEV